MTVLVDGKKRKLQVCGSTLVVCVNKAWHRVFRTRDNGWWKLGSALSIDRDVKTVQPI